MAQSVPCSDGTGHTRGTRQYKYYWTIQHRKDVYTEAETKRMENVFGQRGEKGFMGINHIFGAAEILM